MSYLLDTNIVFLSLKNNLKVKEKLKQLESQKELLCISCITYFEIKRGLPIQTEDILIAATAIVKGLILVSNDSDLLRVDGLSLENWVE